MGMIVAVAVYGAALGFLSGPSLRTIIIAAGSVGAAQCAAIGFCRAFERQPGLEALAWTVQAYVGSQARDLVPTMTTGAFAAGVAAILAELARAGERRRRVRRVTVMDD
jgi:hypothetical protein